MPEVADPVVTPPTIGVRDPAFERFMKAAQQDVPKDDEPPMYAVILHNDGSTNPLFVIRVLQEAFGVEGTKAARLMMAVHMGTRGLVVVDTKDRCETMLAVAGTLISQAVANEDWAAHVSPVCELTFTLEEESKEKRGAS